ncbi:MAG: ImmA/IrrE family metallo-endopeptidase [Candidatus Limnocylindrales bacterium]
MRQITTSSGSVRLWYEPNEIEAIARNALREAGLLPSHNEPRVDIERVLESHLAAEVDYGVELDDEILGYTVFDRPIRVGVNRRLTDAALGPNASIGAVGRWRATIAHEAAHVLLHTVMYPTTTASPGRPAARCFRDAVADGARPRDWREVQANMGMAALLMPRWVFASVTEASLSPYGPVVPPVGATTLAGRQLVDILAQCFQVSRRAAAIRLEELGFLNTTA